MDVISITRHTVPPGVLLRRLFEASQPHASDGLAECLTLDRSRRDMAAGAEILRGDGVEPNAWLLVSGVAGEMRTLADGHRQVIALRLPGDLLQGDATEAVCALTQVELVNALSVIRALGEKSAHYQPLRRAWVAANRVEQGRLRDHVIRLGGLSAFERMAHLFMEVHDRLGRVGLATPTSFHLPVKQDVIADLLGLSVVHVSRTVQSLKRDGLAHIRSGYVTVLDRRRLAQVGHYVSRFASPPAPPWPATAPLSVVNEHYANVH
jgi:CRP-like cAMP-binding protein